LLALAWAGTPPGKGKKVAYDSNRLMRLQAIVNDLVRNRGAGRPRWTGQGDRPSWAHPGKCLFLELDGTQRKVGVIAELEPALGPALGLSGDLESEVVLGEICLDALLEADPSGRGYTPLPRYPGIKVDVAVSVPDASLAQEWIALITQAGKKQVVGIELFDLYRGDSIGAGRKSLAFHVLLQSESKTLSDKDENRFLERFEKIVKEAGGELRKG
jgi:phenylalanyl-tRNA synthetase beta chain